MAICNNLDPRDCVYGLKICDSTIDTFFGAVNDKFLQEEILDVMRITVVKTPEMLRVALSDNNKRAKPYIVIETSEQPAYLGISVTYENPDSNLFDVQFKELTFEQFKELFNDDPEALKDIDECAVVQITNEQEAEHSCDCVGHCEECKCYNGSDSEDPRDAE